VRNGSSRSTAGGGAPAAGPAEADTGASAAEAAAGGELDPELSTLLVELDAGRLRAAEPDATAPDGWRVNPDVKAAILGLFRDRTTRTWDLGGALRFRDRVGLPPKDLIAGPDADAALAAGRPWRVVPGGTAVRAGVHFGPGVVVMPPSYVNVGAWVGEDSMVDSHVLVGSCAQIGARVHLSAGVTIGGVLEPAGARPVIVDDDAFVGAGVRLLEGVLVGRRAVIGAGVVLTGTSRVYDLVRERVLTGTAETPLAIPPGSVVVPGTRRVAGAFAEAHGLAMDVALLVKERDERTDARVALEEALR
jgi:2,3,4,5-tetrahydropyridine-2,6-dicarboxylate N-succinyltransferase